MVLYGFVRCYMGVSENSVPLHPMVLLIIIPMKNGYFIGNISPTFSDKPTWGYMGLCGIIGEVPNTDSLPIGAHFVAPCCGCCVGCTAFWNGR